MSNRVDLLYNTCLFVCWRPEWATSQGWEYPKAVHFCGKAVSCLGNMIPFCTADVCHWEKNTRITTSWHLKHPWRKCAVGFCRNLYPLAWWPKIHQSASVVADTRRNRKKTHLQAPFIFSFYHYLVAFGVTFSCYINKGCGRIFAYRITHNLCSDRGRLYCITYAGDFATTVRCVPWGPIPISHDRLLGILHLMVIGRSLAKHTLCSLP